MDHGLIESEENSSQPLRFTWLTPMVVMWTTVVIVIALIVLGTWLNKRKAAFDTHEAREKLESIVREANFTPQQVQMLTDESESMLESAGVGIARREAATRWFHRMEQSLACVALQKKVDELDALLRQRPASDGGDSLLVRWHQATLQAERLIFAVDRHDVDPAVPLAKLDSLLADRDKLTVAPIDEFGDDCRKRADKVKVPPAKDLPVFDLYSSLHRGIVESKNGDTPAAENEKAAQR